MKFNRLSFLLSQFFLATAITHAATINVTSGGILSDPVTNDSFFNIGGEENFSADGLNFDNTFIGGTNFAVGFGGWGSAASIPTVVHRDGFADCVPQFGESCGWISMNTLAALPPVVNPATYHEQVPFTVNGQLRIGPGCTPSMRGTCAGGADLAGSGTLTVIYVPTWGSGEYRPRASFDFTPTLPSSTITTLAVSEPKTLGMLMATFLACGLIRYAKK